MFNYRLKIANFVFEIDSHYDYLLKCGNDYLSNEKPDFHITTTLEDIGKEKDKYNNSNKLRNRNQTIQDDNLESLFIMSKMCECLIDKNILFFHGATISKNEDGFMFVAPSGTGKSTHIKLWMDYLNAVPINGDMPILEIKGTDVYAYGSPWCGDEKYGTNSFVKIKAICLLTRSESNYIEVCDKNELFDFLLDRTYKFSDSSISQLKMLRLLKNIVDNVKLYKLSCNTDREACYVSYNGMKQADK